MPTKSEWRDLLVSAFIVLVCYAYPNQTDLLPSIIAEYK